MSVLLDDQMNSVINCLTAKSTWDDLILYHEGPSDVKESSSRQKDLVSVKSSADDTKLSIPSIERPWLSEAKGCILLNHDTGRILPTELQRNTTDPPFAVTDSLATDYDSADESSVCSTPLPPLKKLDGAEPIWGPKTINSNLRSKSTFKAETLKGFVINKPSSTLAKDYDHETSGHNRIISLEREINQRNPQHALKRCEACGSSTHTATDHYDIEWLKRGEALQAKKAKALKSTRCDIRKPIWYLDNGCSRHMTGVKSYLHKYVEQPGPKVVFVDDSTCTTEGYGFIKCNGIVFRKVAFINGLKYNLINISQLCDAKYIVQFNEKRGTIFNSNKEVVMIAPRVRDVYVLNMTSSIQESCLFSKASDNLNWIWHKRLAHLNLKTINKLAKQNLVIGLSAHLSTQRTNHVRHEKKESIIGLASKQNRHLLLRNFFVFFTWIYLDL
ncbi:retrovirus-related pol polyprotein from transposon TNT 1-94 [Tanacetum coccineum]